MAEQGLEGSQPVDLSKHPSGIVPTFQNIVSTVNLDCKLDLKSIALQARNAEYNPKRFAAVIMRIREPKTTALIFASDKMVCTGAKSEQQQESMLESFKSLDSLQSLRTSKSKISLAHVMLSSPLDLKDWLFHMELFQVMNQSCFLASSIG
ncbi:hypothetical protein Droror1_Dr00015675 [Drosera rotundifolia]